jgi:hypothetical protein
MMHPRAEGAAVQLKDGTILVVGGRNANGALGECEVYDPRTSTWSATGSLNQPRYRHDVQLLPTGEVIAIGGLTDPGTSTTETCELYDPATKRWSFTDPLPEASENIYAKVLPDGSLFASGGLNANSPAHYVKFACVYSPATHRWTRLPDMLDALDGHNIFYSTAKQMVLVASGLYGGASGVFLKTTQILRDGAPAWERGVSSSEVHDNTQQMATQLPDETPVLCGGRVSTSSVGSSVESYDFITEQWSTIGTLVRPHWHCWAFVVGLDKIILIGGAIDPGPLQSVTAECTWFDYATKSSTAAPAMIEARNLYAAAKTSVALEGQCIHKESIYVFGGQDANGRPMSTCERLEVGIFSDQSILTLSPNSIRNVARIRSLDTLITFVNASCAGITIDSLVAADAQIGVTAPVATPMAQGQTVQIPVHLTFNADSVNTAIRVRVQSSAGTEVRWIHVTGSSMVRSVPYSNARSGSTVSVTQSGTRAFIVAEGWNRPSIEVYSTLGQRILEPVDLSFSTSDLASGLYFLRLSQNGRVGYARFVIQH